MPININFEVLLNFYFYLKTGLLLVVKLGRNVVMMSAGVKIMHQSNARRP